MGKIFVTNFQSHNQTRLMFSHDGGELPGGTSVLRVSDGAGGSWNFNCRSEGGKLFSISGSDWSDFAETCRINDTVTLFKRGGNYTITVRHGA
ncbi:hypothetical protein REPUB_Repub01dG0254600 [Reevesia pubescens]